MYCNLFLILPILIILFIWDLVCAFLLKHLGMICLHEWASPPWRKTHVKKPLQRNTHFLETAGQQWMAWSFICNSWGMEIFKNVATTAGCMTTISRPNFAFVWMGRYQLHSLTIQGWFTTVRLQSLGKYMRLGEWFLVDRGKVLHCLGLWKHE